MTNTTLADQLRQRLEAGGLRDWDSLLNFLNVGLAAEPGGASQENIHAVLVQVLPQLRAAGMGSSFDDMDR